MIEVKAIEPTRGNLRKYVAFGNSLYKDNPCYVPPLMADDVNTLSPGKNPAFDHCQARCFMAYRDGKPVGRITGIINTIVNGRTGSADLRFGFVDFIDDDEVVDALFKAVSDWGRSKGMTSIVGPMGFSDMDHEGMLTFGYDEMGTMATIYNHPYYVDQIKRMGFRKDAGWVEYYIKVPEQIPEKYQRIADIVKRRENLKVKKYTSRKKIKEEYGVALFELINRAYDKLYGYSPLTPKQIDYYIEMYLSIINLDLVTVVTDAADKLIAIGISIQ